MGEVIAFVVGAVVGIALMCIVSVNKKDPQEDEEQMQYLKEWNEKHK